MPTLKTVSAVVQGIFYLVAGRAHFTNPDFFLKIMPPYLPWHLELVYLSGVAEILLGLGMLFPAVYHLQSGGAGMDLPTWALWLRLPFQGVFIAWAYWHTTP